MNITVIEESIDEALPDYSTVPISFLVASQLRVEAIDGGLKGLRLIEERVEKPYIKDYDQINDPLSWPARWDMQQWGMLSVFDGERRVGGALIAWQTPSVNMLDGRDDLAVLWDLRIHGAYRRKGVGRELFTRITQWAQDRTCQWLKIETQNINVAACRFYAKQGCHLGAINRWVYPDLPEETQLLWYLDLRGS